MARRRFVVRGMVQGVYFRTTAAEEAHRLGITGRVWNRDDGAVECLAEGEPDRLERFRGWLAHGPPTASVERVDVRVVDGPARYEDFRIARGHAF